MVAVNFSNQIQQQTICFKAMAGLILSSSPLKRSLQLAERNIKMTQHGICLRMKADKKPFNNQRLNLVMSTSDDFNSTLGPVSASSMIEQFYTCINDKKLKELDDYIADDCYFEDCSFPTAMQGKKEVMSFFQQLSIGMGRNAKFSIEHVCEDDELTAGVNWHLEWNQTQIPFTRGCSFYECLQEGDRLLIKKALVMIESPIKPGGIVLVLLKNVTAIFDEYPNAAEWFLKSFYVILQFLSQIYSRLCEPIIKPLLEGYIRLWNCIVRLFNIALHILIYISKKYLE